jgi:tetratricopeptide (TPR) repeat protein
MGLARFYYQTSRPKRAIGVLQKVRSHAHEISDYFQLTGMFYQSMGDGDEALRQYKEGARDDPKNKEIYQKLSIECLMRQGRQLPDPVELDATRSSLVDVSMVWLKPRRSTVLDLKRGPYGPYNWL